MATIGPALHANVTADGAVKSASGQLVSVLLTSGGAAATLVLYDNDSAASGTVLATIKTATNNDSNQWSPAVPYVAANGIYADITGTGASATVVYL
jgi:hypothetical protein